jgi:tellurite resistance protein TerC
VTFQLIAVQQSAAQPDPVPWFLYAGFIGFVIAMLLIDLRFFHADVREDTAKQAGLWVIVWVALALIFGLIVYWWKGFELALLYLQGYIVEYSLSADNIFVFILIFAYFRIPPEYQHRVLFYGILGAIVFRGIFIALGVTLISRFEWVLYIFGVMLIITAVRVAIGTEDVSPDQNPVLRLFQRRFRSTTRFHGNRMFTIEDGKKVATPLFIVVLVVETTDIIFAVDSIPAIFGITQDPFIILTSNVFAILGLRALYFLMAESLNRLHLLKYGLSIILAFVGLKMLTEEWIHVEAWQSLAFIVGVLVITATTSLIVPPRPPEGFSEEDVEMISGDSEE